MNKEKALKNQGLEFREDIHFKGRCKPMDKRTSTNGNKVLGYIAKRIAVRDANTTCPFLGYQPKLPTAVKKLKNSK